MFYNKYNVTRNSPFIGFAYSSASNGSLLQQPLFNLWKVTVVIKTAAYYHLNGFVPEKKKSLLVR